MRSSAASISARWLLVLGRIALAGVFLYAAYTKLWLPRTLPLSLRLTYFTLQVDSYQLLPPWAVSPFSHTLPWFELGLGVLLLAGRQLRYVAAAASVLLVVFSGVMLRTYAKGLEINCGCFGPNETLGVKTLFRDGLLLALSLAVTVGAFLQARSSSAMAASAGGMEKAQAE